MTVPLAGSIRKLSSKTVMVFFERTTEIGRSGSSTLCRRSGFEGPRELMVIVPIVRASPTPEAERIERRDKAAFWLGMTLAVIVGLNAEYFGKPFGALDDYARLLAWALSTSIGVDLATLGLSRVGTGLWFPGRHQRLS